MAVQIGVADCLGDTTCSNVATSGRVRLDASGGDGCSPAVLGPARRVRFARATRLRLGYFQSAFAETFRIPLGTLRDWEQHRREPDQAARAYLDVIAREPEAVIRALAQADEVIE